MLSSFLNLVSSSSNNTLYQGQTLGYKHLQSINSSNGIYKLFVDVYDTYPGNLKISDNNGTIYWRTWISSYNKSNTARMQTDGNFVLYDQRDIAIWSSGTNGLGSSGNYRLVLGDDAKMRIYDAKNAVIWTS